MKKIRLDVLMVQKGLTSSRERARALIMAGRVTVNGVGADKPGKEFPETADILMAEDLPYVGRGGLKLEAALDGFGVCPEGLAILDAGASTGGFTHCLMERGAARILAVDVGYGQFDWALRNDKRVTLMERTNLRFLDRAALPFPVDAAVADLSFISLKLVLPKLRELLPSGAWLIALVKPQFEVGRQDVGKGGVVRDPEKMRSAVAGVALAARMAGFVVKGELESPVRGAKGNREFFLLMVIGDGTETQDDSAT